MAKYMGLIGRLDPHVRKWQQIQPNIFSRKFLEETKKFFATFFQNFNFLYKNMKLFDRTKAVIKPYSPVTDDGKGITWFVTLLSEYGFEIEQ